MTYRERRTAKAERLQGWAEKRQQKAATARAGWKAIADTIPFAQPILVGHHSEAGARRDQARIVSKMDHEHEHAAKAAEFASRAASITEQAHRAIYSDDLDAIERLRDRIVQLEAKRARMVAINAEIRRRKLTPTTPDDARVAGISAVWADMACTDEEKRDMVNVWQYNGRLGYPPYEISNVGGNIAKQRHRLAALE